MLRNRKIKRNWNNEDISLLVWLVSKQIERRELHHFSELVKSILFRKNPIGNTFHNSSQEKKKKSVNSDGLVLRRLNQSHINGQKYSLNCQPKPQLRMTGLTGNQSHKSYISAILQKIKFLGQQNSVDNIGTVFSILTFKKVLGLSKRIEGFQNMFSNFRAPKNGLKYLNLWMVVLKML